MDQKLKILHLEDLHSDAVLIGRALKKSKFDFERLVVDTKEKFIEALKDFSPDIILSDHSLPSFNSHEALEILHENDLKIPFILITATVSEEFAVDVIKRGADDYILKDRMERLPNAIHNSLERFRLEKERQLYLEQIIKNEKHFRALIENTGDGMAILSAEGKPFYVSPSIKSILGYTVEEGMQLDLFNMAHPEDVPLLIDIMKQAMENPGVPIKGNPVRMKHKDGSWKWLDGVITNMLHDPAINGIVDNFRDVSDKILAEKEVKASEEKYRSFFENNIDGILLTVTDGNILAANPAACTMFQMTEEEICKAGRFGLADLSDPRIMKGIEERQRTGKAKALGTLIRKDGSSFQAEINSVVFRDGEGKQKTSMLIRDLTEMLKAEKDVKELQSNLQSIFESTSEGFILVDLNGCVKAYNNNAKNTIYLNVEKEIEVGSNVFDFIHPSRKDNYKDSFAKILNGKVLRYDYSYTRKNGEIKWFDFTINPVYNSGNIEGIAITSADITDRKTAEQQLQQSEFLYRQIVETAEEGIWLIDENNLTTFVNEKLCNILQYSSDEILGKKINYFIDDASKQTALKILSRRKNTIKGKIDVPFRTKSGTKIFASIAINPVIDENGNYKGMLGMVSDITDKKNLQDLFDKASALARIGSYEVDLVSNTLYWSDITKEIHEVDSNFIPDVEKAINFYKEGWSRDSISKALQNAIEKRIPMDIELQIITAKGNERWVRVLGEGEFANGKCIKVTGSFQDIDKTKIAELELLTAYEEKNTILESIGDAFFAVDKNWIVTYWNNEAEKLLEHSKNIMVGKSLWDIFADRVGSLSYKKYHEAINTKQITRFEDYYEPLKRWFEISAYPANKGLSVYFKNITDRKLAELRVSELNEKLKSHAKELAVSNKELEDFAYVASHDLQEPLRMVTGFLGQIEKKYNNIIDDKGKQYIHFAVDGAKRMRQIILDLLEFSRVGRGQDKEEDIDLNEIMKDVTLLCQKQIAETKAIISYKNLPILKTYKTPLRQLFQNLLSNAIKYSKKEEVPVIKISAEETDLHWQFSIKDNGIGIEEEYFNKIFVIFQRLHNKDEYSGTGLGLAICKKIIDNLGGKIWLHSQEGKGSTFYFTIPKKSTNNNVENTKVFTLEENLN